MFHAPMGRLARRQKKLQRLTRFVENVVITTKGLQERTQFLNGTTVKKVIPI